MDINKTSRVSRLSRSNFNMRRDSNQRQQEKNSQKVGNREGMRFKKVLDDSLNSGKGDNRRGRDDGISEPEDKIGHRIDMSVGSNTDRGLDALVPDSMSDEEKAIFNVQRQYQAKPEPINLSEEDIEVLQQNKTNLNL